MGTKGRGMSKKRDILESEKKEIGREGIEEKVEPLIEPLVEEITKEEVEEGIEGIKEKEEIELTPEEKIKKEREEKLASWKPKTALGLEVKQGKIMNIDELLGRKIFESEIIDILLPSLEYELINIGHARGKFGGGKRRAWRQTQKKTAEGNVPEFSTLVVVGDKAGHIGIGYGKAKETLPAREKAIRNAKINIFKVVRGCGSFDCGCNEQHSIPVKIEARCGSSSVVLKPAPRGTGLVADDECKKIFRLAGIKDIYVQSRGKTRTKINHIKSVILALKKLNRLVE
ncbi:MAG: 30S ribosomal protein S5 [Candidatus Pacearchaeota archaeon]